MTSNQSELKEDLSQKKGDIRNRTVAALKMAKVILDILKLLVYKHTPLNPKQNSVEDICNYFAVNQFLSTSGQPTQEHFKIIQNSGYTAVINLATGDFIESPLENEAAIVAGLGMKYHHIPVDFSNPTNEDFNLFVKTMQNLADDRVWVHCFLNARASAFVYKYRISELGEDREKALWDLREVWEPFGIWKRFVFGENSFKDSTSYC
jgi:protein tyrosine phosphatase (PTP) superfamily phosphohydrolase (DUF442 family)